MANCTSTLKTTANNSDGDVPITLIVRRRIRYGREAVFDKWTKGIAEDCKRFDGYVGTRVIQPQNSREEFVTIISFDSCRNYLLWEDSTERREWLQQVSDMTEGNESSEYIKGFEFWLGEDYRTGRSWPPDFRMVVVAYVAIWPLVFFVDPLVSSFLPQNSVLASLASTAVITLLMGYVSLPLMTKIFGKWLMSVSTEVD